MQHFYHKLLPYREKKQKATIKIYRIFRAKAQFDDETEQKTKVVNQPGICNYVA